LRLLPAERDRTPVISLTPGGEWCHFMTELFLELMTLDLCEVVTRDEFDRSIFAELVFTGDDVDM
jgi:hypothetical protein